MNDIINGLAGRCFFFKLGDARKCAIYFFVGGVVEVFQPNNPMVRHHFPIQHVTCNLEKHCEKLWDVAWNMLKSIAVDLVGKPTQTHKSSQASGAHKPKPVANPVPHIPTILAWRTSGDWLVPFFRSCARFPGQKASNIAAFPTQMGKESIKSCQYHSIEALQEHWVFP